MWPRQRDGVTCGPSVAVMAGALLDDEYGAPLRSGRSQQWFDSEQLRVHRAVNRVWPRALGTTPAGMARALTKHSGRRGVRYRWRPARPNRPAFKKAGNLHYAYERTDGDFIVTGQKMWTSGAHLADCESRQR